MTSCLVIGANGFLGANMSKYLREIGYCVDEAHRDTSRAMLAENKYDVVFNCAGNSKTWLSEKDPAACLQENVATLIDDMKALNYELWVQVSSSTVYGFDLTFMGDGFQEDQDIAMQNLGTYAFHKLLAEHYVQRLAKNWLILRASGFFGPGLKKNLLFDLRNNVREIFYTQDSYIDYLPTEIFSKVAVSLTELAVGEVVNVGAGVSFPVKEIVKPFDGIKVAENARYVDNREFSLKKLEKYFPEMPDAEELKSQIMAFVKGETV